MLRTPWEKWHTPPICMNKVFCFGKVQRAYPQGIGKSTESHKFQGVFRVFSGRFQGIFRAFSGSFQGVLRKFQGIFRVSSGCFPYALSGHALWPLPNCWCIWDRGCWNTPEVKPKGTAKGGCSTCEWQHRACTFHRSLGSGPVLRNNLDRRARMGVTKKNRCRNEFP